MLAFRKIFFWTILNSTIALFFSFVMFSPASAALSPGTANDIGTQLEAVAGPTGANVLQYEDPRITAVRIITTALTLVGTLLFILIVYAGFLWMTAGGNEEQVEKAKKFLRNGVIGLVIILASYTITIAATNLALGRELGCGTSHASMLGTAGAIFFGNTPACP